MMNFMLSDDLMKKDEYSNKYYYNTQYDGTINMNSVLMA
jgi:hypothetical protein